MAQTKGETSESLLNSLGKRLLKKSFRGVYALDELSKVDLKHKDVLIVNVDKRDSVGSHWIGISCENDKCIIFDSFGRKNISAKIAKNMSNKHLKAYTESDAEQNAKQEFCGQACLAFCVVANSLGNDYAKWI